MQFEWQLSATVCTHWKSKMRNFKVGNKKYPSWKLVMRKLKLVIGNVET